MANTIIIPFAQNGETALYYETEGPASAPSVAFVCGIFYAHWMWNWQRERLSDDYEVLLWDNRGAGNSDVPEGPYTMAEMAADLEAILAVRLLKPKTARLGWRPISGSVHYEGSRSS